MLGGQASQCLANPPSLLGLLQSMPWPAFVGGIERLKRILAVAPHLHAHSGSLLPFEADGRVDGDAIQPGEKQRVAFETVERLIRIEEGLLHHVLGVLSVLDEAKNAIV